MFNLLALPFKIIMGIIRVCGWWSVPLFMVLWAFVIGYFKDLVENGDKWELYHQLGQVDQVKLLTMVEIAALAYVEDSRHDMLRDRLFNKKYYVIEIKRNDQGLTYVVLYHETENKKREIYISFRGSSTQADYVDDALIALSRSGGRFVAAVHKTKKLLEQYPDSTVIAVGHSLGGSTVQHVMKNIKTDRLKGFTVNSYGLPDETGSWDTGSRLTNIIHEADIAQAVVLRGRISGTRRVMVRGVFDKTTLKPLFNMFGQHKIFGMLDNMVNQCEGNVDGDKYIVPDIRVAPLPSTVSELVEDPLR